MVRAKDVQMELMVQAERRKTIKDTPDNISDIVTKHANIGSRNDEIVKDELSRQEERLKLRIEARKNASFQKSHSQIGMRREQDTEDSIRNISYTNHSNRSNILVF